MNAARIRAIAIVGVLLIGAVVIAKLTISDDKQSHANYAATCPAGTIAVVTSPLPDYQDIKLQVFNGSKVALRAQNVADELSHRGFNVVQKYADKPVTQHVADIYYGPKTVAAAWVVRSEFLLTSDNSGQSMHFDIKDNSDVVQVVVGTNFLQLGAQTEVNQAIAALKNPPAPPGTCAVSQ